MRASEVCCQAIAKALRQQERERCSALVRSRREVDEVSGSMDAAGCGESWTKTAHA